MINCVFCAGKKQFGNWRSRKPENVLQEIELLMAKYGIQEIAFTDSNININKNRFKKMLELMDEKKLNISWMPWGGIFIKTFSTELVGLMKKTGCHSVYLSVEHGNPEMQKYIGKIVPMEKARTIIDECREYGIWTHGNFVLGLPGETRSTMHECLDYSIKANFDSVSFHIAIPLPGSRLYDELKVESTLDGQDLRFKTRKITWAPLSSDELTKEVKRYLVVFVLHKILSELNPRSIVQRIRSYNKQNFKLFRLNAERSMELFFRLFR